MADELEPSLEQLAYEAKEVKHLLTLQPVHAAFKATAAKIVRDWQQAMTIEERERQHVKWEVFRDWQQQLRAVSDRPLLPSEKE